MVDALQTKLPRSELVAGRYRFLRELSGGSSGRVWLVEDQAAGSALRALKWLPAVDAERAQSEFALLVRIAHPGLAQAHDLIRVQPGELGSRRQQAGVALVSEYVSGEPIDRVASMIAARAERALAGPREALIAFALRVLDGATQALAALHAQGFVHGDVKPDHLLSDVAGDAIVLLDLGLARPPGIVDTLSGSPHYMAPELFRGELTQAADVYALGLCLRGLFEPELAQQAHVSMSAAEHLARALAARPALPGWLPAPLRDVLERMGSLERSARPASALELQPLLSSLAQTLPGGAARALRSTQAGQVSAQARASAMTALPLCGQARALSELERSFAHARALCVLGPRGAGRSRLVRDAVFALQLKAAGSERPLPSYLPVQRLPQVLGPEPCVWHVLDADDVDVQQAERLVRAAELAGTPAWLVLERSSELQAPSLPWSVVEVGPLERSALLQLLAAALGKAPGEAWLRAAQAQSGGLAGRLCRALAGALLRGDALSEPSVLRASAADGGAMPLLSQPALTLAQLLALAGGSLPAASLADSLSADELAQAARVLCTLGLCTHGASGQLQLRSDLQAQLRSALVPRERARLLAALSDAAQPELGRARAFLAHARGRDQEAWRLFQELAQEALASGDPGGSDALLREAEALIGELPMSARVLRAESLRALARYREALTVLSEPELPAEALLLRAELLRLSGQAHEAWSQAQAVLSGPQLTAANACGCHALLARLCLDRGELSACRQHAQSASDNPEDRAGLRASEVSALADLAEGQLEAAFARAQSALQLARRRAERTAEARLCAVLGAVERARGELARAAQQFARASELADAQGEQHAAVSFSVNLATAQLDAGQLGPALSRLRSAASACVRLGRERDMTRVLANWILCAQLMGDHAAVLGLGERLRMSAERSDDPWALAFGLLSCAETALEQNDRAGARERLGSLPDLGGLAPSDRAVALARSAVLWAELSEPEPATQQLMAADALDADAHAVAAELHLARSALARVRGDHGGAFAAAESALREAERRGEFPVLVAALTASASSASALGNASYAHLRYSELRALLDTAALTLSGAERALLRNVRGYRAALAAVPAPDRPGSGLDQRFRQLTEHVKRLTAETRLPRVYERILEAAITLSGAERGLLLRRDLQGNLRMRAQLGAAGEPGTSGWSHSIVSRVLAGAQALATVNAAEDARLAGASSVHALALRSVLALPLRTAEGVSGVIYLEDRLRPFAFGEAEVALLSDFADLASLAITSVERLRRERRAVRRLSLAQARLASQLEAQALELSALKQAQAPDLAHTGIVAQSASMREVLSLALRVAGSDVPVLIRGESGTGKELVARAIHAHSARSKRPFISESCGAIPEGLLESALFGHVKGAFTGADRRRVGLFEAADGGTLLLDEIAEMSPSMQTRLLRVLQEGEIRPVGGERTVRVDVRVVAATHRDLEAMVADGRFREDLFYRLAVVSVQIPPLRERGDDIVALVQHFVQKHAPGRSPLVSRRALARLMTQPWPGNVRQLENEVRRALILGGDVLREEHFGVSPPKDSTSKVSDLNLRGQVDELERKLIRRALELARGNQTRAAELLGVSRFGLQKMVKRLGLET